MIESRHPMILAGLAFLAVAVGATAIGAPPPADAASAAREDKFTPVVQTVPTPPRWFKRDDGAIHVEYELLITNASPVPVDVTAVGVLGPDGQRIDRLSGSRLEDAMTLLGTFQPTTEIQPSTVGAVWMDLVVPNRRRIPTRVSHRVTVDVGPDLPVGPKITQIGGRSRVVNQGPSVIAPPVRGPRWAAVASVHRRSLLSVNGRLRLSQRFAVDFSAQLDREDRTHVGSSSEVSSYFNYGKPLVAVSDAKVVAAVDRYPDQIPNDPQPVSLAAADGNHVIIKLDKHVFAGYAHLKPGSVRVHPGEHVKAGQILGKLGNSGNTTGPHLHFQLMDRPSLLASDGLPFVFDGFKLEGRMPSVEEFVDADLTGAPVPIDRTVADNFRRRGLTTLDVVSFPGR
jgi:hypothetical protein